MKRAITKGRMDQHAQLAVHAASGMTREEYEDARDFMASIGVECPRPDALVRGAIIGAVRVTGVTKVSDSPWFFGPWALVLADAAPVEPLPCSGELGAFQWHKNRVPAPRDALPWMVAWPDRPSRPARPRPPQPEGLLLL